MRLLLILSALILAKPAGAQEDDRIAGLRSEIAMLEAEIRSAGIPELLITVLPATGAIRQDLGLLVIRDALPPAGGVKRIADRIAADTLLRGALSDEEIAAGYALRAYYGRGCYGWAKASRGLAAVEPDRVDDATILMLAVLTIGPSYLARDEARRGKAIARTIERLLEEGKIDAASADRLASLPLRSPEIGPGCR